MEEGTEDKDRQDGTKGFAGLSSLVSNVDATISDSGITVEATSQDHDRESARTVASKTSSPSPGSKPAYQPPPQSSGGGSAGMWIAGIAVVVGLIWLASFPDKRPSSPSPTSMPGPEHQAATTSPPVWQQPSPAIEEPRRPTEEPPPVGNGLTLTMPQLRYCTAENIRLTAARPIIKSDNDFDRFNALVADYNSRCAQFRYTRGSLESARFEVEASLSEIEAEGRARFAPASAPVSSTDRTPQISMVKPDSTVQEIQRQLKNFGYDAGEENGLAGEQTRAAISAFQRDHGISVDGKPSLELLKRLSEHLAPAQSSAAKAPAGPPAAPPPDDPSHPRHCKERQNPCKFRAGPYREKLDLQARF